MSTFKFIPNPDFSRLRKALLRLGEPDCVPFYELFADPEIMDTVTKNTELVDPKYRSQVEAIHSRTVKFFYMLGYDYATLLVEPNLINNPQTSFQSTTDTAELSRGNRKWINESQGPISSRETYEKFPWPSPNSIDYSRIEKAGRNMPDGMMGIGMTGGVLEFATWLMGYQTLSYGLLDHPDLIKDVFDRVGEVLVSIHTTMSQMDFIGAMSMGDDMGFRTSTMISPEHLRRYVFPWQKKIVDAAHAQGKPFILHSCGKLDKIMDDLIDFLKIDAKHSYEDTIMPVIEAKKRYGNRISILGGVDIDFLCRATTDEVRKYTRNVLEQCAPGGGYCLGTGNSVANYIKLENYLTMLDEGIKYNSR